MVIMWSKFTMMIETMKESKVLIIKFFNLSEWKLNNTYVSLTWCYNFYFFQNSIENSKIKYAFFSSSVVKTGEKLNKYII